MGVILGLCYPIQNMKYYEELVNIKRRKSFKLKFISRHKDSISEPLFHSLQEEMYSVRKLFFHKIFLWILDDASLFSFEWL